MASTPDAKVPLRFAQATSRLQPAMALDNVLRAYESALTTHPARTKGATGWVLALLGDGAAQAIQRRSRSGATTEPNLRRSFAFSTHNMLWTSCGLHPLFNLLDRLLPGTSLQAVAGKTSIQLLIIDPFIYLPTVYFGNGLLLGQDLRTIVAKMRAEFWRTTVAMWKFWAPATVVLFRFIPLRHQSNFINGLAAVWLVVLSLLYNRLGSPAKESRD